MRGGGGAKPTEHHLILAKYEVVHTTDVSEKYSSSRMLIIFTNKNPEHLRFVFQVRGRPFDSEGRGLENFVGTDYLVLAWAQPINLFSGIQRPEYLFSSPTKCWKSNKKSQGRGEGVGMLVQKRHRAGVAMWFFFIFADYRYMHVHIEYINNYI